MRKIDKRPFIKKWIWVIKLALILVILGGLRLGCIGFFGTDFIGSLLGSSLITMSGLDRILSCIVGIAAIYSIYIVLLVGDDEVVLVKRMIQ